MADHFKRGTEALSTGAYSSALRFFEAACQARPHEPRLQAYRAWSRYMTLKNGNGSANRKEKWLTDSAANNCKSVIHASVVKARDFDAGYVFLGRILTDEGSFEQAAGMFKKALRINESNPTARKLLTRVERKSTPPCDGSMLGRLGAWWRGGRSTQPSRARSPLR